MKDDNRAGWYALYLSITQNLSPARALSAMEGRKRNFKPLSWEEFITVYRAGEARLREMQRKRNGCEKTRAYQREYRKTHPMSAEQRLKRAEYLRMYRAVKKARSDGKAL
jgi:hypothetical protein